MNYVNRYYDKDRTLKGIQEGRHRQLVGGLWDQIGGLQLDALKSLGLQPSHTVLDIGCGSLRLGARLVDFLEPSNYFGTDLSSELMDAGYAVELSDEARRKLPRQQLIQHDISNPIPFRRSFDYIVAFSLFTHLPISVFESALSSIAKVMEERSVFLSSFFISGDDFPPQMNQLDGVVSYADRDPFHYPHSNFRRLSARINLRVQEIEGLFHSRGQRLFAFFQNNP